MKQSWIWRVALLAAALQLAGCVPVAAVGVGTGVAVATDRRTSATYLSDSEIELRASGRINANFSSDKVHVNASSFNRTVLLTGQAPDDATRQQIADLVDKVPDVNKVIDQIAIGAPTDFSTRSNDVYLSARVNARLMDDGRVPLGAIKIETENGVVYLMGFVSQQEGDIVANIASGTPGVHSVVKLFEYH